MSVSNPHTALAVLDLIERLGRYGARLQARGLTAGIPKLDAEIEQARLELARLQAPDDAADRTRYAELVDELRSHRSHVHH